MTTILFLIVLAAVFALLVTYARHDHFAGPANAATCLDDLGPVDARRHLVPRP